MIANKEYVSLNEFDDMLCQLSFFLSPEEKAAMFSDFNKMLAMTDDLSLLSGSLAISPLFRLEDASGYPDNLYLFTDNHGQV
jgi:hypothetical protein